MYFLRRSAERRDMRSPFSGMDPFIEASGLWEDFHAHLIEKICDQLADTVPERYTVRTGERSYVVLADANGHTSYPFKPDARITTPASGEGSSVQKGGTALAGTESAPVTLRAFV